MAVPYAADRFETFGSTHLVLLVLFAAGFAAVIAWGRSHRGRPVEERYRRLVAVVLVVFAGGMQVYQLVGDYSLGTSLPMQLCDWAWVAAVIALWTRSTVASAIAYYVGLTLSIQGIVTPSLAEHFPDPRFFGFWGMHFVVVWTAAYLTWGLGIRPTWRSYYWAVAFTSSWALTAYVFNLVADTNYGYLNRKPPGASLLDYLGPWPQYVFLEIAIILAFWALVMTLPWVRADERRAATREPGTTAQP